MTRTNIIILSLAVLLSAGNGYAGYGPPVMSSTIDPGVLVIDEEKFLGVQIDKDLVLVDHAGAEFKVGDLAGKPLILVLSYYKCDGSCPVQNKLLKKRLLAVERLKAGTDYNVLTVSFDSNDDIDRLKKFARELDLPGELSEGWTLALLKDPEAGARLAASLGFKYFWSATDKVFLHPSVFIFLSGEGRVMRYLYSQRKELDVELALLDAGRGVTRGSKAKDLSDIFLAACFSYNFEEGRYAVNYPLFIAAGSLILGISLLALSMTVFKRKARRKGDG